MNNNRHTPEQIVRKLREAEAKLGTGASVSEVVGELGIGEATFHRNNGARHFCRWPGWSKKLRLT